MKFDYENKIKNMVGGILSLSIVCTISYAQAVDDAWVSDTIADAKLAAPPAVTEDATILGWTADGELTLARYGGGPYTLYRQWFVFVKAQETATSFSRPNVPGSECMGVPAGVMVWKCR